MHRLSDLITAAIFIVLVLGAGIGFITATERVATWQGQIGHADHSFEMRRTAVNAARDDFDGWEDEVLSQDGAMRVAITN